MSVFSTVITGTGLATGKTFTHGLGTTPDFVLPINEHSSTGLSIGGFAILTFNSQTFTIATTSDAFAFRVVAMKIHSILL